MFKILLILKRSHKASTSDKFLYMANIFKEAKKVQRAHPRMTWQQAIQAASKKHNRVGAVKRKKPKTKFRQTGSSNKGADSQRRAKPPGKRRSASGRVYYERRKNRSDKPGLLTGVRALVKEKLGKALLDYELATTITATKAARKRIIANRKIMRVLK